MPYNITSRVEVQSVERLPNGKWAIMHEAADPLTGLRQPRPVQEFDSEQAAELAAREAVDVVRRREIVEQALLSRKSYWRQQQEDDDE